MTERGPTILQIVPRLDAGGAELSAIEIAEAVSRAGGRAIVLSEGGRMASRIGEVGGELVTFPAGTKNPARLVANARAIAAMIRREGVDLVHARSRAPAWSALWAARLAGTPFVTTYHGAYNETNAAKRLYNGVMARGDVVIANSRYTRQLIESRYGTAAERLVVIHRGIDEAAFDPSAVAAERIARLRQAWGVAEGQRVVLLAARLTAWKGQSVLIAAARMLAERGRLGNAVIVLAGDAQGRDGYVARLTEEIAAAGLNERVRMPGHVSDMPAAFAAAFVTAVPSTEPEAFGRSAAEAQAMGCPVIASRLGAPQETVRAAPEVDAGARTGWLVTPGDAGALADALAEALQLDPAQRAAIGERARRHALAGFTLTAMKRATLQVYDRLLATRLTAAFDATCDVNRVVAER